MPVVIESITPSADQATDAFLVRRGAGPLDHTIELLEPAEAAQLLPEVTVTDAGTMSAADKVKLDAIGAEPGPARWYAFDDMQGVTADVIWAITNSGTGAGQSAIASKPDTGPGWNTFALGTTATGRTARHTSLTGINLADGLATYGARFRVGALSDGVNTYTGRWGFIDSISAESIDGVFFRYTHSVNGGRFQAVTRNNNTETAADTGITAAINTTYAFRIEVDTSIPEARFYIDGALVATITTNIPTGAARAVGVGTMGLKSLGVAATSYALMDYQFGEQVIAGRT